ncbi:MAG: hypothetical protein K6G81_03360 [Lachnospiraceae bacterium]|nr:hypothetical protein [Lachnospiraceae bacterium]
MKRHSGLKASLTVEAGLVLPIFIFAVIALCFMFRYLDAEYAVQKSMLSVVRALSPYPEIVELADDKRDSFLNGFSGNASENTPEGPTLAGIAENAADAVVLGNLVKNEIRKYPFALSGIYNGENGINCYGSILYSDSETVLIRCGYCLKLPVSIFGAWKIPIEQELEYRYFTGLEVPSMLEEVQDTEGNGDDRIVYITEEKKVYHQSLACPCLKLVIRSCSIDDVPKERNIAGGRYYKCERCARGKKPDTVFISKDGDRYHYNRECGGLKRTITEILLSEASRTRRPCKRCMPKGN